MLAYSREQYAGLSAPSQPTYFRSEFQSILILESDCVKLKYKRLTDSVR
jgi:hypothetical protein